MTRLEEQARYSDPGSTVSSLPVVETTEPFEQRWAQWQARGRARAVRTRQRMFAVSAVAVVGGAGWLAWVMFS